MNGKTNQDIRSFIKESGVYSYMVAEHLNISTDTLCRMLRKPLTQEEKTGLRCCSAVGSKIKTVKRYEW